jgi:hypothetical protein
MRRFPTPIRRRRSERPERDLNQGRRGRHAGKSAVETSFGKGCQTRQQFPQFGVGCRGCRSTEVLCGGRGKRFRGRLRRNGELRHRFHHQSGQWFWPECGGEREQSRLFHPQSGRHRRLAGDQHQCVRTHVGDAKPRRPGFGQLASQPGVELPQECGALDQRMQRGRTCRTRCVDGMGEGIASRFRGHGHTDRLNE